MARGARGFRKLRDKYIISVNNNAFNVVTLKTACGRTFEIEAVVSYQGVNGLEMTEIKKEKKTNA